MNSPSIRIPVNEPLLDGNEAAYLLECVQTGWISSEGPFISRLEEGMAKRVGRSHGVAVSNGSVALDLALAALRLGPGDEIILPTFTIISCAAAVIRAGAIPVLVDCDPSTGNMKVDQIEQKVGPKTKAIMAVHIYGLPVDMDPLLKIAERYDLRVIEDAAEMLGQCYKGRPCGSFGDLSTFSFYANKHVTTGEGGMVLTNNEELAERCRSLRNLAFGPAKARYMHEELGWNFRMSNLQAAVGVAQLERLDEFVIRKREMGRFYSENLGGLRQVQLPISRTDYAENIFWVYGLVLRDHCVQEADTVIARLGEHGVGTRAFFWPMHEQPVFRKLGLFEGERYPHAERLARRGFYLPSGLGLTPRQQEAVISIVKEVLS